MGACLSVRLNTENSHPDRKSTSASVPPSQAEILQAENLKSFRFNVLQEATEKFHPNNELGEGRFSTVYKGWIDEQSRVATKPGVGTAVAVKRFNKHYRSQSDQDWLADMDYFGQLNHENLLKYIGYCLEGGHRLLVYDFMPRGSLANHLFIRGSHFQCLSWKHRIKVALGAAKGLAYLHCTQPKMINVYFKSSNILIDSVRLKLMVISLQYILNLF
ncbi:putative transferase, protein kinase RLK-Pelle-RLCK-VIIa-2 family [Helianthus debilis subsp. tardiflorus]